jgi:hypothetical protein
MFTALPVVFNVRPINTMAPLGMLIPPFAFVIASVPAGVVHDPDAVVVHMGPLVHVVKPLMVTWSIPARVPPFKVIDGALIVFAFAEAPVEKFRMPLIVNAPTLVTTAGGMKFVAEFPPLPVDPVML